MRVTVNPQDPDYVGPYRCAVRLNGVEISYVVEADEEARYLVRYRTDARGRFLFDPVLQEARTERLCGDVYIDGPREAIRTAQEARAAQDTRQHQRPSDRPL